MSSQSGELRKFSDLRKRAQGPQDGIFDRAKLALISIGATEQGDALKDWLSFLVFDTALVSDASAWAEREARRRFAAELLQMMEAGANVERGSSGGRNVGNYAE